jgi:hypothetical protein
MQGKKRPGPVVLAEDAAQAALRRGAELSHLASDEEKVIRMRLGAGLPPSARLERIATASDAEIELLAYEIEAFLHLKERSPRPAPAAPPVPTTSRVKEKIVRALRRKP